jgi:putative membrane protein
VFNKKKYKMENNIETKYNKLITAVSIIIPIAVAALFGVNLRKLGYDVAPLNVLPPIYATINAITAVLLIIAVLAIKNGKRKLHENLMKTAIACSLAFLLMYVAYHMTSISAVFGDVNHNSILEESERVAIGFLRIIYLFILVTHISLSVIIIPLVLITYVRALSQRFDKHKKIAKITFPIWLYVAVTGVIVYIMIAPYYVK